ncbi:uncharacterized protein L969DRAFT_91802 [Mixia osmundae IAM 14324]|uniref:Carrier domain-containing protein n=1 Tax=Mixia osmundae (strain CBS 9802 / IAM 14324 / JCM 22182 / KY 12970) TaxID=764103 RepID=G7EAK1_MIXOS|nr:uncharacterized protein L969DRAFT_91802 [Mixia osmundae IAM 14324]KEI42351.1 hypothetical protein L969DRAFT_91802 [Mixia osmundae IAM 14324]GAA99861.1 hypothetical protein E5Q_06564 [Mixia osmundae IAM 14324]
MLIEYTSDGRRILWPNDPDKQAQKIVPSNVKGDFTAPQLAHEDGKNGQWCPEMIDHHLEKSPDHLYAVFPLRDGSGTQEVTWREFAQAALRAAHLVSDAVAKLDSPLPPVLDGYDGPTETICIMTRGDSIVTYALMYGIMRAGYTVFPLSPRNSAHAQEHLLKTVNCRIVLVEYEPTEPDSIKTNLDRLAAGVIASLQAQDHAIVAVHAPHRELLFDADETPSHLSPITKTSNLWLNHSPLLLHSSGTTSVPKVVRLTYRVLADWLSHWRLRDPEAGVRYGSAGLPVQHTYGVAVGMCATAATGGVLAVFEPAKLGEDPIVPDPSNLLDVFEATNVRLPTLTPSIVEGMAKDPALLARLKGFKAVFSGGGPLSTEIGDYLNTQGIVVINAFGATETGFLQSITPATDGGPGEWRYNAFSPQRLPRLEETAAGSGIYELFVLEHERYHPLSVTGSEFKSPFDGRVHRAYPTKDLMEQHATDPLRFAIVGRADDQIMLSTGEKIAPAPIEDVLNASPLISTAIIFGRGRESAGVLIDPARPIAPDDMEAHETLKRELRPDLDKANKIAPAHARLFIESIVFVHTSKPISDYLTQKGSVKKVALIKAYETEIDALASSASHDDVAAPADLTPASILTFVRDLVNTKLKPVLSVRADDNDDIFNLGCDSLFAMRIFSSLRLLLPRIADRMSSNIVFRFPTIARLSGELTRLISGGGEDSYAATKLEAMTEMVDKYTQSFANHVVNPDNVIATTGAVVLLTGSTGGLGAFALARLLNDPAVCRVYALNRRSTRKTVQERQRTAFLDVGIDAALLSSPKLALLAGDLSEVSLGLADDVYDEIRCSLTTIIHNSWQLNFSLSLASFEPLVCSVRRLVDFALASPRPQPPHFVFTSSIGTLMSYRSSKSVPEERLPDLAVSLGNGYGESKRVGEEVLFAASELHGLPVTILRIGQLCGATSSGYWASSDWVPAIVKSGEMLGELPDMAQQVDWLPIDVAGRSTAEFALQSRQGVAYRHLIHHERLAWHDIFERFSQLLGAKLVDYPTWLERLRKSGQTNGAADAAHANPALKLLDFYTGMALSTGALTLRQTKTLEESSELRSAASLTLHDVKQWHSCWTRAGLLTLMPDLITL